MEKNRGRPARFDRDKVLKVATDLFARHGFEGTSLAELVREIGCTPPSLYNYFPSKEDLYLAVLERYWDRDMATFPDRSRARDVLEAYVDDSLVRFSSAQGPKGCLVLTGGFRESADHQDLSALLKNKRTVAFTTLVELTKAMQTQGDLDPGLNPETWARSLFALVQGLALQAMDGAGLDELIDAFRCFLSRFSASSPTP